MSASKETAHFYCDFNEPEADSGDQSDDDTNAKNTTIQSWVSNVDGVNTEYKQVQSGEEELRSDNGKIKKKRKLRKMVKGIVSCLPQERERVFGQPKTHKQELREENKDWKKRWEITEKELGQLKSAYDAEVLKSQIQQTQIHDLEREKAELLNRLSKIAGDRLTHENLNITDLSDVHRPIKLSDTYCELYDNEWTDAFQELTDNGLTDKEAVGTLLDIILVCFHKCREITWERYQTLKHIVSTIDIAHVPGRVENLSEVRNIDACTNNASDESAIEYSRDKESLHSPQPKEEVDSPDICNNASNKLEISCSLDEEVERPSQSDETEIRGNADIFPLSIGSASDDPNGGQRNVEHMKSVCNQDISNNASKSEIASNANKKVGQPSQCEETEVKGDGEIFPKSNGTDLDEQNRLERTVEYTTSVSDPYICTNNPPKDLEQLYSGKREVQRSKESKDEHFTATVTLHFEQEKQIKDIWRTTTTALKNEAVKHLYLVLLTSFDIEIKDLKKTSKYLTSCIDLCWKMGVQEKPMHLVAVAEEDIESEKIFDQTKFKAFTKSGEKVDFVVWPALFLYEGGPMLFKGIAQGCKISDN